MAPSRDRHGGEEPRSQCLRLVAQCLIYVIELDGIGTRKG
jgi:hypothetical protein